MLFIVGYKYNNKRLSISFSFTKIFFSNSSCSRPQTTSEPSQVTISSNNERACPKNSDVTVDAFIYPHQKLTIIREYRACLFTLTIVSTAYDESTLFNCLFQYIVF
jgi:hypothetical protein